MQEPDLLVSWYRRIRYKRIPLVKNGEIDLVETRSNSLPDLWIAHLTQRSSSSPPFFLGTVLSEKGGEGVGPTGGKEGGRGGRLIT